MPVTKQPQAVIKQSMAEPRIQRIKCLVIAILEAPVQYERLKIGIFYNSSW